MSFLVRFKLFLDEIETASYYRMVAMVIGGIVLLFGLLFYFHTSKIAQLEKEIKTINREREKVRTILEQHNQVAKQQEEVESLLAQDKTFKIKEWFERELAKLGLQRKLIKSEAADPQDLRNGYNEIKLDASFTSFSMQELVQLMNSIEDNRRIYIKDLDITSKNMQGNAIDVTLVIATLHKQLQT